MLRYPPPNSIHAWTRLIMDCRALSEVPGRWEWFDRNKKRVGEVTVHFQLQPDTKCPHMQTTKVFRLDKRVGCTSKTKCFRRNLM